MQARGLLRALEDRLDSLYRAIIGKRSDYVLDVAVQALDEIAVTLAALEVAPDLQGRRAELLRRVREARMRGAAEVLKRVR